MIYKAIVNEFITMLQRWLYSENFYGEGSLSAADYELVEVTIANKYRISRKSVVRMHFLLKRCGSGFEID